MKKATCLLHTDSKAKLMILDTKAKNHKLEGSCYINFLHLLVLRKQQFSFLRPTSLWFVHQLSVA